MANSSRRTGLRHLAALSDTKNDAYRRVLDAIALQRRNPDMSLSEAARHCGTTLATVQRHARSAITQKRGRWEARPYDELPRRMLFLTDRGYISIVVKNSDDATLIAQYFNEVRQFLTPSSSFSFDEFEGDWIESEGRRYYFVTDAKTINRLARAGVLSFLDIYASDGGAS